MSEYMDDFLRRELRPTKPEDLPGGAPPIVTHRFIVEVTCRYSDPQSAVASRLQQDPPDTDWPWHGRVLNEDGTLAVNFPIVCLFDCDMDDPDIDPRACDPAGSGCAAPKPTTSEVRITKID